MIYDINQVTTYDYDVEVPYSRHRLHVAPRNRSGQTVISSSLSIGPPPAERVDWTDFFGNATTTISIDQPHDGLALLARARVLVEAREPPEAGSTPDWRAVRASAFAATSIAADAPGHFIYPSRHVPLDAGTHDYAAPSFAPGRPMLEAAIELMHRLHEDFTFDAEATDTSTLPAEAFALRRGVCQDFANVMIAGMRGLGLPACYVSGFIRTIPPPGRERLVGADASHAWVMVWCGDEAGWIGLDPTNAVMTGNDHILIAVGRDYCDVAPVSGVMIASGGQSLSVEVDVVAAPDEVQPELDGEPLRAQWQATNDTL